ncbi:MAG: adenylyltransferase/cytidyltransferase family protein [Phycisphaerales bacterium]|nr:adenylyltransferase/cytidyltransferase family protein [Phycisphaerales bacterium]MCB9837361.1 adenylyltransferase/cytidyltransferase family protein [Phycisphaera sp.]
MTPRSGPADPGQKILSLEALVTLRRRLRIEGRSLVVCHGCFDIVHPGHIRHLRQARTMGDVLLVSLTGDAHINKGAGRPLIPQEHRAENLAALDIVDLVYVDPNPTALSMLEAVEPDVYIKGREYENNADPRFRAERETVEKAGGRVVFSSGDVVFSSSALIDALGQSMDPFHSRLMMLLEDPQLSAGVLDGVISGFRGKRVVVVGETIRDTYVICDRPNVAGESPMLTLRPLETRCYDGGAAIIARHAAAMGARPVLITALPEDDDAYEMRQRLTAEGVEVVALPVGGAIPEKQRFVVGTQKVVKIDLVRPYVLDATEQDRLVSLVAQMGEADVGIVADFGLGLLTSQTLRRVCQKLTKQCAFTAGDVSGSRANLLAMRGLDLLTPSESELRDALRSFDEALPAATWKLLKETATGEAIVTMGPEGLVSFTPLEAPMIGGDGFGSRLKAEHVPALASAAVDQLGCGDALLTTVSLARAGGAGALASALLGAVAASVQAGRMGNLPVSATDLRRSIARLHAANLTFASADVVEAAGGVRRVS